MKSVKMTLIGSNDALDQLEARFPQDAFAEYILGENDVPILERVAELTQLGIRLVVGGKLINPEARAKKHAITLRTPRSMTCEELAAILLETPKQLVMLDDPNKALVGYDKLYVEHVTHMSKGPALLLCASNHNVTGSRNYNYGQPLEGPPDEDEVREDFKAPKKHK